MSAPRFQKEEPCPRRSTRFLREVPYLRHSKDQSVEQHCPGCPSERIFHVLSGGPEDVVVESQRTTNWDPQDPAKSSLIESSSRATSCVCVCVCVCVAKEKFLSDIRLGSIRAKGPGTKQQLGPCYQCLTSRGEERNPVCFLFLCLIRRYYYGRTSSSCSRQLLLSTTTTQQQQRYKQVLGYPTRGADRLVKPTPNPSSSPAC